jgi:SAM-dependent methyltransferase
VPDEARRLVRDGYERIAGRYLAARPRDGADLGMLTQLVRRLRPASRVLDAGCGAGVPVAARLLDAGHTVTGLDLAVAQLRLARRLRPAPGVVTGDLGCLPCRDAAFDGLVSFYAVIHVPRADHGAVFREFRRVLRPGGSALLCLGARDVREDHDPDSWLGAPMFWSHFDAPTNLELLAAAGWRVVLDRLVPDPMGHGQHLFALLEA